jgi:membrane dipeptidase
VPFVFGASPDTGPGLTASGRALVRRCAELGVLVDLAHLNEAGFWDVAALEAGPLVSSHTAAWSLCACTRNLTDRQLDAVRDSGGLVGIVYACPFVRSDFADDPDTPLSTIAAHVRYVADRIGVDHVALGSDFDGATLPAGFDVTGLPRLLDELAEFGFGVEEIERIAWRNWRRVCASWWRA